jgi:DNA modification methylase
VNPYYSDASVTIFHGDCRDAMQSMDACSIDSIVCDPPYGLTFMGKAWDRGVPGVEFWEHALRVAKPGAHLVAFGGTRMFHRLMCGIEDAGWELRDTMQWMYGGGFPKSHNVSKAIDKEAGAERTVIRTNTNGSGKVFDVTAPATDAAKQWDGWGTALKPAWEPIVLARKPFDGTVAQNVQIYGTGALNIAACRLSTDFTSVRDGEASKASRYTERGSTNFAATPGPRGGDPLGRWPANVLLDEEAAELLDRQTGTLESGEPSGMKAGGQKNAFGVYAGGVPVTGFGDSGGASRFYYCAKASQAERNAGTSRLPQHTVGRYAQDKWSRENMGNKCAPSANTHPTVKPIALMQWLVRLVTPPNGLILDPFMGSGSTGVAALSEGFRFIGIEKDTEHGYCDIALARMKAAPSKQEALDLEAAS